MVNMGFELLLLGVTALIAPLLAASPGSDLTNIYRFSGAHQRWSRKLWMA